MRKLIAAPVALAALLAPVAPAHLSAQSAPAPGRTRPS